MALSGQLPVVYQAQTFARCTDLSLFTSAGRVVD